MKVLVTGARGFIGQCVGKKLTQQGIDWVVFEGDILRDEDFTSYDDCDVVIHLAAKLRAPGAMDHLLRVNTEGTLNVLRFVSARQRRIIFTSSYLYGSTREQPIKETHPITYDNPYSFSKWHAEKALMAQNRFFGMQGVILRIFNAYGPGQQCGFLIPDIFDGVRKGRVILRNLTSRRDFIFIDDLAELIVLAVTNPLPGLEVINAGSGTSHSVIEMVNMVFNIIGRKVPLENHDQPVTTVDMVADIDRARELFGWRPETSLDKGLSRVAASLGLLSGQDGLVATILPSAPSNGTF